MENAWDRAALALQMLSLDPIGLGGAVIRMRASPWRNTVEANLPQTLPLKKIQPTISDIDLFGGVDVTSTLQSGQLFELKGLFSTPSTIRLSMAERCEASLAAKLGQQMDQSSHVCLILFDEGATPEERCPPALTDRIAFQIAPDEKPPSGWHVPTVSSVPDNASVDEESIHTLVALCARLGIHSLRAPLLALKAAKAHARLHHRSNVSEADIAAAVMLVLAHRATQVPQDEAPEKAAEEPETQHQEQSVKDGEQSLPHDMLIEAVIANLPRDLLTCLVPAGTRSAKGTGAGNKRVSKRRGRPLPPRAGRPDGRNRIDLIATLRTAAPWQSIRRLKQPNRNGVLVLPSDIRLRRYQEQSERLLIFTVDASGSAAVARLGEAKGAVELLLADAYAKRDHVALISFRGTQADLLLPPTRSLVQTKRRLAALPGGGGTPLAAGLEEAAKLAQISRGRGLTPTLVLLTDGRANIALDGAANRTCAQADAETLAKSLRRDGTPGIVIDMGKRPSAPLEALSALLDSQYVLLPRANARSLQNAVTTALSA